MNEISAFIKRLTKRAPVSLLPGEDTVRLDLGLSNLQNCVK